MSPALSRTGRGAVLLPALAALLAACPRAAADNEPNAERGPAVGAPVSLPLPTSRPVRTITQRIVLTDEEARVLEDVQDRTDRFDETPLYAMLAVTARAPQLDVLQWEELDRPAYVNLLTEPDHYRFRPLQMKVKVFYISKLQSGAGLNFSRLWPQDRPIWEMDCIQADTPYQSDKPVRLYSVVDPEPYIGPPDEKDVHNRGRYKTGREIRIAGLFFKLYRTRERSGDLRDYPQVMVWQISRTMPSFGPASDFGVGRFSQLLPVLLLIVALGVGFYLTRRRLARLRAEDAAWSRRRPPRQEVRIGGQEARGAREDGQTVDGPVDPELAEAARQFRREKGLDDDEHHRG